MAQVVANDDGTKIRRKLACVGRMTTLARLLLAKGWKRVCTANRCFTAVRNRRGVSIRINEYASTSPLILEQTPVYMPATGSGL